MLQSQLHHCCKTQDWMFTKYVSVVKFWILAGMSPKKTSLASFPCFLSLLQVPVDEVCGCPLVRNVFEPTGEYCRMSKRKCNRHYCWEKLRRAEVDLERVRVVGQMLHLLDYTLPVHVLNNLCIAFKNSTIFSF